MRNVIAVLCGWAAYLAIFAALIIVVGKLYGGGWAWALVPFEVAGGWAIGSLAGTLSAARRPEPPPVVVKVSDGTDPEQIRRLLVESLRRHGLRRSS